TLTDDLGRVVHLHRIPQRIVSLAPHATELLFDAGAGSQVVAVDVNSDEPQSARALPRLSAHPQVDFERLTVARPDLIVVWRSGLSESTLQRLSSLAPVFVSDPRRLQDIAKTLQRWSAISNEPQHALRAQQRASDQLTALESRHAHLPPVRVFYQVWRQPLITLSNSDVIGDAIRVCGGRNVFGHLPQPAPVVDVEAVLAARPQLVLAPDPGVERDWRRLGLGDSTRTRFATFDASALHRPTLRALDTVARLCGVIDNARS
ncbi:MAG TPA: helical backbone metal receptor, partial [Burkholderiaceae bacterium]|nr:helical backbone metal receptor [Burkholderiaceae bacterium]